MSFDTVTIPPPHSRSYLRKLAIGAAAALAGGALIFMSARTAPSTSTIGQSVNCANRVIVIDTSSSARNPALAQYGQHLIEAAAQSAIDCETDFSAFATSGGGTANTIVTSDDLAGYTPQGPTPRLRASRFTSADLAALDRLITGRLRSAYRTSEASVTSVEAMYALASEQSDHSDVVLITSGVDQNSSVNLNQPLATGEGTALAKKATVPSLHATALTMVGLAQVDTSEPPPSAQWPDQIEAFNAALCRTAGARSCHLFELTSVTQALNQ